MGQKFAGFQISRIFAPRLRENAPRNAEIAQLVEHNLAKVGVASSSLVFRSTYCTKRTLPRWRNGRRARFRCEC